MALIDTTLAVLIFIGLDGKLVIFLAAGLLLKILLKERKSATNLL